MAVTKIRLEKFGSENYAGLIAWVDGEETLMQFAGPLLKYPLTAEQLDVSLSDKNRLAFRVVDNESNQTIGHSEIYLSGDSAKIGRILIGDKQHRGKGLGRQIVSLLLDLSFTKLNVRLVELNVFDWNVAAITCYQKAGFSINPDKTIERKLKDKTWIAINMTITKWKYEQAMPPHDLLHD